MQTKAAKGGQDEAVLPSEPRVFSHVNSYKSVEQAEYAVKYFTSFGIEAVREGMKVFLNAKVSKPKPKANEWQ
jgi:hypothetical protein